MAAAVKARPRPEAAMSPFWVSMRNAERRILAGVLADTDGNRSVACELLGISQKTFLERARYLGGVLPDEPIQEPPGSYPIKLLREPRRGRGSKAAMAAEARERGEDEDEDEDEGEGEGEGEEDEGGESGGDETVADAPGGEEEA